MNNENTLQVNIHYAEKSSKIHSYMHSSYVQVVLSYKRDTSNAMWTMWALAWKCKSWHGCRQDIQLCIKCLLLTGNLNCEKGIVTEGTAQKE